MSAELIDILRRTAQELERQHLEGTAAIRHARLQLAPVLTLPQRTQNTRSYDTNTLAGRINSALRESGMNAGMLARACAVSRVSVNKWMRGQTQSLNCRYLFAAATALNVSPEWLATGDGLARTAPARRANHRAVAGSLT
jgi:transcriptional regulator with XRE-family HTH domain